jgi:hypothetical protein
MKASHRIIASVAVAASLPLGGCDLLAPRAHATYALVSVNGHPLPAVVDSGPLRMYSEYPTTFVVVEYVSHRTSGSLEIVGHDFTITVHGERTIDGVARPDYPPFTDTDRGYFRGPDSLSIFEAQHSQWSARFSGDTAVSLVDITGFHDWVHYDFRRTR